MAAIFTMSYKPDEFVLCFNGQRFLLPSIQLNTLNF